VTVRTIRQFGDPVLRQECRPVTAFDDSLRRLVEDLMDTCRLPGRAGLAAPQIGVPLRVFSYNVDEVEGYVINPEVVHQEGQMEGPEGCLSIPELFVTSPRAERAVVRGVDLDGRPLEVEGTGLMARCLQHETDHLKGTLFVDRLGGSARRQAFRFIRSRYAGTG
jgi:peptide deformylase